MAVLLLVCFTTSNPPICLGLSFWIHAIGLCSSNIDTKTQKNSRSLRSPIKISEKIPSGFYKLHPSHRQANPFKPLAGSTYTFMKPFEEMQHSKKYTSKYPPPVSESELCGVDGNNDNPSIISDYIRNGETTMKEWTKTRLS